MGPGDVVYMTSFKHIEPSIQVGFKAPAGRVAVFMLVGDANKKAPETYDVHAALNRLGWHREDEPIFSAYDQMVEALENLENDRGQIPDHAWKLVQKAIEAAKSACKE